MLVAYADYRQRPTLYRSNAYLGGDVFGYPPECRGLFALRSSNDYRYPDVSGFAHADGQRDLPEQDRPKTPREQFSPTRSEDVMLLGAVWTNKIAHILHNAKYRYLDLVEHIKGLPHIGHRDFLRRGHQYCTLNGNQLRQTQLRITRPRRHIDDE